MDRASKGFERPADAGKSAPLSWDQSSEKRPFRPGTPTQTGRMLQPRPPHTYPADYAAGPAYAMPPVGEPANKKKRGRPTKAEAQARADAATARGEAYRPSKRQKSSLPSVELLPGSTTPGPAPIAPIVTSDIYSVSDLPLGNNESPYHDSPPHSALQAPGNFPEVPQLMPQPSQHFTPADNFGPNPGMDIHGGGHKAQDNPADSQNIIMQDLMSDIEFAPPEITTDDAPRSQGEFLAVPQTDAISPPDRLRCECSMQPS